MSATDTPDLADPKIARFEPSDAPPRGPAKRRRGGFWRALVVAPLALGVLFPAGLAIAEEPPRPDSHGAAVGVLLLAESSHDVEDYSGYSWRYYFALTRGVSRSTIVTPLKPPLFILTIPLDLVMLPFSAVGGFF